MRTIQSEFQKHGIKNKHNKRKKNKQQKIETFSEGDMRYLMGVDKPTYKRHKGAYRQR